MSTVIHPARDPRLDPRLGAQLGARLDARHGIRPDPRARQRRDEVRRSREELLETLFSSLSRRDQRVRGEHYLRGLLLADGRKSVRNIALSLGLPDEEQRLHHFISGSTWDWAPMRAAHAGFLERVRPPQAWVLHAVTIPKVGEHTVGVDRFADTRAGRTVSGQRAFAAWYASAAFSAPVNWRLFMPRHWMEDAELRTRAEIPPALSYEPVEQCGPAAVLEAARDWQLPPRPVLMDLRGGTDWQSAHRFLTAGLPVLARTSATDRFVLDDAPAPGSTPASAPAASILDSVRSARREVEWADPGNRGLTHTSWVTAVRVRLPYDRQPDNRQPYDRQGAHRPDAHRPLLLLGEWHPGRRTPAQIWVTDLVEAAPDELLRLTKLTRRVALDQNLGAGRTGTRDFVGRSFCGWHRHMTLASAAHTMRLLGSAAA
ncbi:IS701 family transposase [Streptomyces antibioticus]|uniref:IS701 family transposase n=1 Tax=Streptomyces antibioticus TaxID=1890 RepID=UPI0022581176|nr:transposase [Streptomyces antibioticus]MCX5170257.1 transposase [Streptomyces antibioticus]